MGKFIFSHKDKYSWDRKMFLSLKRKNCLYLNKRKKVTNCTEMNCSDQSKKNWIDFLFHCNMKRVNPLTHEFQFHWSTKSRFSGMGPYWPHFQLKVRDSVTSSLTRFQSNYLWWKSTHFSCKGGKILVLPYFQSPS